MSSESSKAAHDEKPRQAHLSPILGSGWNVADACIEPLHNLLIAATEVVLTVDLPYVNQRKVKLSCPTDDCIEVYGND